MLDPSYNLSTKEPKDDWKFKASSSKQQTIFAGPDEWGWRPQGFTELKSEFKVRRGSLGESCLKIKKKWDV